MQSRPTVNPVLRQVLELGPTIGFVALYFWIRDETFRIGGESYSGFIVATLVFVPILLVAMAALWRLTGRLSRLQLFTVAMVVVFGALTAWFNDERFFKLRTTIVYGVFAALLGIGLAFGRSPLEWAMGELLPMRREGWMILTRRLALAFLVLAVANEAVWRTQPTETWVVVESFIVTGGQRGDITQAPAPLGRGAPVRDAVGLAGPVAAHGPGIGPGIDGVAVPGRRGIVGWRAQRQSSSARSLCRRKATIMACSATLRVVACGSAGPMGISAVVSRWLHFCAVVGRMPWPCARALTLRHAAVALGQSAAVAPARP
jgi:intracellular septation protein